MNTNPTPYARAWADAIKAGRKRKGYSRSKLAALLDVTYQAVQNWELGASSPAPRHQAKLVGLFGISPQELSGIVMKGAAEPNGNGGEAA